MVDFLCGMFRRVVKACISRKRYEKVYKMEYGGYCYAESSEKEIHCIEEAMQYL